MPDYKFPVGSYKKNMDEFLASLPDDKMFYVRLRPEDCSCGCFKSTFYRRLNEEMPVYFLSSCHGFKQGEGGTYEPVFTRVVQAAWNAAYSEYLKDKAEWCAKWGCD